MKSLKVILAIALVLFTISWFIVSPVKNKFSVLTQRENTSKSSSVLNKWDGKGKFIDMIWE